MMGLGCRMEKNMETTIMGSGFRRNGKELGITIMG